MGEHEAERPKTKKSEGNGFVSSRLGLGAVATR
jgi:hypothetical protein